MMLPPLACRAILGALAANTAPVAATPRNSPTTLRLILRRHQQTFSTTPKVLESATTTTDAQPAANVGAVAAEEMDLSHRFPPESPKSIIFLAPRQDQLSDTKLPPHRGILPIPRNIFPRAQGDKKVRPEWIERATPLSKAQESGLPPRSEVEARKRAQADMRRANMKVGLYGLWARKRRLDARLDARSKAHLEANYGAATAPERPDDLITRPSVRLATQATAVVLDPDRFDRAVVSFERTAARAAARSEARRDALSQVYMAAGNFIVDEAELAKHVDDLFRPNYFNERGSATAGAQSVWGTLGCPPTLQNMVATMLGDIDPVYSAEIAQSRTTQRQLRVSEELTGGRLSEDDR